MKGRLPTSLETLPPGVAEVSDAKAESLFIATYPIQETASGESPNEQVDKDTLDRITEPKDRPSVVHGRTQANLDNPWSPIKDA